MNSKITKQSKSNKFKPKSWGKAIVNFLFNDVIEESVLKIKDIPISNHVSNKSIINNINIKQKPSVNSTKITTNTLTKNKKIKHIHKDKDDLKDKQTEIKQDIDNDDDKEETVDKKEEIVYKNENNIETDDDNNDNPKYITYQHIKDIFDKIDQEHEDRTINLCNQPITYRNCEILSPVNIYTTKYITLYNIFCVYIIANH